MSFDDLDDLARRIAQVNPSDKKNNKESVVRVKSWAIGYRMISDLCAGILVGLIMGWGIDKVFGTSPWFMIVFLFLGFIAGVRVMIQTSKQLNKKYD